MNLRTTLKMLPLLGLYAMPCDAQVAETKAAEPMARVEVTGPGDLVLRRNDTAARIVVGRDELTQYGDNSLSAALKRQPGISIAAGEVRMRGLGSGYTQILVNGDPVAQGFSIDSISPELIERIEILRSASAEYSAQAIAGTINLILRKTASKSQYELKAGAGRAQGRTNGQASLQRSGRQGSLAYSVGVTVDGAGFRSMPVTEQSSPGTLRRTGEQMLADTRRLSVVPRLNWTLANGDTIGWQSLLDLYRVTAWGSARETTLYGAPSAFPNNSYRSESSTNAERSDLTWAHKFGTDARLSLKLGGSHEKRNTDYLFRGEGAGDGLLRGVVSSAADDTLTTSGKYLARLMDAHSFAFGWDGGYTKRAEVRLQDDSTLAGALVGELDADYAATVRRIALFAQDEWEVTPRLQAYLGLRWEGLGTGTVGRTLDKVQTRSSVWSPVAQMVWKLPGAGKDQLRLALARTYKAPLPRNLVPRRYTINNDNGPTNPDMQGDPALRPELAWGLDAAYESYFGKGGVASVSVFGRRIRDVTVQRVFLDGASWVSVPVNDGTAAAHGIEFDAKVPLDALPLDLRANAARNWSRVDSVQGPDNRLAEQTPLTINLGADYRLSASFTSGANFNFQNGGLAQLTPALSSYTGVNRTLDLYGLWKLANRMQLRLSVTNALHQDQRSARYFSGVDVARTVTTPGSAGVRMVVERVL